MAKTTPKPAVKPAAPETADKPSEDAKGPARPVKTNFWSEGQPKITLEHAIENWSPGKHNPLTADAFEKAGDLYRLKAHRAQLTVNKLLQQADDTDKYGSAAQRKAAEKLRKQKEAMAETQKQLREALGDEQYKALMAELNG